MSNMFCVCVFLHRLLLPHFTCRSQRMLLHMVMHHLPLTTFWHGHRKRCSSDRPAVGNYWCWAAEVMHFFRIKICNGSIKWSSSSMLIEGKSLNKDVLIWFWAFGTCYNRSFIQSLVARANPELWSRGDPTRTRAANMELQVYVRMWRITIHIGLHTPIRRP